ncbi:MAG TPA: rhomboid family intramembrane serine protease, partial [Actinomycetota bacterium]|nr:rhomboid family intramembrane serine protease [Actinomycetota bacterium]
MISLIPIHDQNPTRRPAVVTYLLIAANVIVFLLEPVTTSVSGDQGSVVAECRQIAFFRKYAAIPRELTTNKPLGVTAGPPAGPNACRPVRATYHKIPFLSVLTAMFLHGGWLHLLGNMLFLYVFGNNVEDRLGHLRFLLFYIACGYVAAYGFALTNPNSSATLVGASGAIAGVLGAYLVLYPRARVTSLVPFLLFLPVRLPAWIVLGSWFVLQWLYYQGAGMGQGS